MLQSTKNTNHAIMTIVVLHVSSVYPTNQNCKAKIQPLICKTYLPKTFCKFIEFLLMCVQDDCVILMGIFISL
jgi:hypothetical protein